MERLTFEGNFCDIAQCRELPCKYGGNCTQKQVWGRLKQFEDTARTPEEVAALSSLFNFIVEESKSVEEEIALLSRLRELYKADKDGRVVILPCKLGAKVYRIRYKIADYPDDPEPEIATTWFTPEYRDDIGKTVFLTREEAEKAMKGDTEK